MKKTISSAMYSLVLLLLIFVASCKTSTSTAGIDQKKLEEAFALAQQIANLKCLVVVREGRVIKEGYFGTGGSDTPHDVRSVTKSITGLLVGIAIDKGYIRSLDQAIGDFIDPLEYRISPEKADIRIRHLLSMSGGFEWEELISVSGYNDWIASANQIQYVLDKPLVAEPGHSFVYNSGALHLLSFIVSKATGMKTEDFAHEHLFAPLGIGRRSWQVDRQGFNNGSAGLSLTPYDMVRIGNLVLDHGVYQGKTVVSQGYIGPAIQAQISTNNAMAFGPGYGYCWWVGRNEKESYAFATGWGGQFIVIVPDLRLVVVATNQWSGVSSAVANDQWFRTMDLIMSNILPAFE